MMMDIFQTTGHKISGMIKLNTYEWLTINTGGLGCSTVGKLGPMKTQGLKLANEWVEGSVKEYGDTKEKKQQSIRNKLSCYKLSAAHIKSCEIASLPIKKQWKH
jgi:hypothetical protein